MAPGLLIMPHEGSRAILQELVPGLVVSPDYKPGAWRYIIRFGVQTGSDQDAIVLNRASVLSHGDLLGQARSNWRASSVRHLSAGQQMLFYRRYRVHVFDLVPIYIQKIEMGRRRPFSLRPYGSQEARSIQELAIRALYTAGLDVGAVNVGLSNTGKLYVYGIDPAPQMNKAIAMLYARQIRVWTERMENLWENDLLSAALSIKRTCPHYLLGADPEFALMDSRTGRMLFASDYFPMHGLIGCDARRVKAGRSGYPLAEVRPKPAACPLDLYAEIRRCLGRASRKIGGRHVQWRAGTMPFRQLPVGGHIHFSMLPSGQLLRSLDNCLAIIFLLLENPAAARGRRRRYGWLGDYRLKSHGGFEYRVVPSWLVDPVFARGALCLAKIVGCDWPRYRSDFLLEPEAKAAFRNADQEYFRTRQTALLSGIRALPSYQKYSAPVEEVFLYIEQGKHWQTAVDMRRSWRLPRPRPQRMRARAAR